MVSLLGIWEFFSLKEIILGHVFATRQLVAQPVGFASPDTTQDRLEANAMLIGAPEFYAGLRIRLTNGFHFLGQFF